MFEGHELAAQQQAEALLALRKLLHLLLRIRKVLRVEERLDADTFEYRTDLFCKLAQKRASAVAAHISILKALKKGNVHVIPSKPE